MNIAPEWVEDLPQDIGGMKIYKIKCSPREWIHKSWHLEYFKMHSSKMKQGRQEGALVTHICTYYDCSFKLSAAGKRNISSFQNVD